MVTRSWSIAIAMAALAWGSAAGASSIRDEGHMFSPGAVKNAERRLERLEQKTHVPVVIETTDHITDLDARASSEEKHKAINRLAESRDRQIHDEGIYILLSKRDSVISQPLIREHLQNVVIKARRDAIREAFIASFRQRDFDGGLAAGVAEIERTLDGYTDTKRHAGARAGVPAPVGREARRGQVGGGGSMLSTFLVIGLGIFAVLIILRLLGGLFGRSQGSGYPGSMGMGGQRPGMGPGGPGYYGGGGGYGGRGGGGFFSGLLGGLGGAMAGNWLYDQMSGRHGGTSSAGMTSPDDASAGLTDAGDERIIGADDNGGQGASWDDGGGTGGGDWGGGGGDAGGDWGGGGGGDWGGGGGGGDWGGGGGGGGDW
jgi:uncharacterized membrane protein YgcG